MPNEVTLTIEGRRYEGWTSATVTRSIETIASTFAVSVSERDPGTDARRAVVPGQVCSLALDDEVVVLGYVDGVSVGYDASSHSVDIRGRDLTGQLVDCSAANQPGEWHEARLLDIVQQLAAPFQISVRLAAFTTATREPFARFRIEEGESVFEAIDRACRIKGVLPLPSTRGGIVLGLPSRARAGVRLERGVNILSASGELSWVDRYSVYTVRGQQAGTDETWGADAAHVEAESRDRGITRHRPLTVIAEQGVSLPDARQRANWEASVRTGRSRRASVLVQGWRESRDEGAALWTPGRVVRLTDDWLGLDRDMLIASVVHARSNNGGTTTQLSLYPEEALIPMPEVAEAAEAGSWW